LHAAGLKLAILSQKLRYRLEEVVQREGLTSSFDAIMGAEDVPAFKPNPDGLLLTMERLGVSNDETLYVGDTTIDGETAQRAGVPFAAVLPGYPTAEEMSPYQPVATLPSVGELPGLLGLSLTTP